MTLCIFHCYHHVDGKDKPAIRGHGRFKYQVGLYWTYECCKCGAMKERFVDVGPVGPV